MDKKSSVIPVILCGGSGTRLWPLSRESFPKQYINLGKDRDKSLLQKTQLRNLGIKNIRNPILICNEEHRFIVAEQMREINTTPYSILLEPLGRNTAPAITLSAIKARQEEDDPYILVLSSDHEIKNKEQFLKTINSGMTYASQGKLVTFGVVPTSPETGFGYIKAKNPLLDGQCKGEYIEEFKEKPNLETAKKYIADKRFTWNSGIFLFKAKTIIDEIKKFTPNIYEYCQESLEKSKLDLEFQRIDKNSFEKCPDISFDVAVMEKTALGVVLPLNAGWSDVGSWESVWENAEKDDDFNVTEGNIFLKDTKNSYLRSEKRLIVGIGLEGLVVVETNDALLIANKSHTQKVKDMVKKIKEEKISASNKHQKIYRPWGHYLSIVEEERWQVKLIFVKPGERLSLQMHHHRSEHWVVVDGTAKVEIDGDINILSENQSTYIPLGSKHRLHNPGKIPLILIEVQSGSYVGEDDILRFEDKYGR